MVCGKTCHTHSSPNIGRKKERKRQPPRYEEGDVRPQTISIKTAPYIRSPAQGARLLGVKACFTNVYISG